MRDMPLSQDRGPYSTILLQRFAFPTLDACRCSPFLPNKFSTRRKWQKRITRAQCSLISTSRKISIEAFLFFSNISDTCLLLFSLWVRQTPRGLSSQVLAGTGPVDQLLGPFRHVLSWKWFALLHYVNPSVPNGASVWLLVPLLANLVKRLSCHLSDLRYSCPSPNVFFHTPFQLLS